MRIKVLGRIWMEGSWRGAGTQGTRGEASVYEYIYLLLVGVDGSTWPGQAIRSRGRYR